LRPQICEVACNAAVASIPIAANILLLLASHNNPAVSDFATDTAVADVIAAAGFFPWVSVVVMVSAVAHVPAAVVVLTPVDIPGAHAGAKVSAVAAVTTAVDDLPATVVFPHIPCVPAIVGVPAVDGVPTVEHPFF
jgi:hypothetical protein